MPSRPSKRILEAINALPLQGGMRILEIGCGPGVAAREIVRRWPSTYVLGIDRSAKAIQQALAGSQAELAEGKVAFRQAEAEAFQLESGTRPFDLAFALRVGALDGRSPSAGALALQCIAASLAKHGRIFVHGGSPLLEIGEA